MPTRMPASIVSGGRGVGSREISSTSRSSVRGWITAEVGEWTSCAGVDEAPGEIGAAGWVEES